MKRILLACSLAGLIMTAQADTATATDQHAMPEHGMMHPMMHEQEMKSPAEHAAQLQKSLQLSDDQTAKLKKIFEDTDQQRKTLMDKYKPQLEAFHSDMQKLHEQTHSQINGLLTPKQQQAFDEQCKKHDGMMKHMHEHERDETPTAK